MTLRLVLVDAFTDRPFSGNPAAVAVVGLFPDEARMQAVAAELHQSETAFVVRRGAGPHDLRWFTPTTEVDLCGHATLAAAHVLGGDARFRTRSGVLSCTGSDDGRIEMDFPADPVRADVPPPDLGVPGIRWFGRGRSYALAELEDAVAVRRLDVDPGRMAAAGLRSLIVTAPGDRDGIDCVSRVFAPGYGIPEDPVTGSAHCTLAAYWGGRLGREELVGEQASARGGLVTMALAGDRVVLGGRAVTVATVDLLV